MTRIALSTLLLVCPAARAQSPAPDAGSAYDPAVDAQLAAAQTPSLEAEVAGVPIRVTPLGWV
jgi:hypothetical protein